MYKKSTRNRLKNRITRRKSIKKRLKRSSMSEKMEKKRIIWKRRIEKSKESKQ